MSRLLSKRIKRSSRARCLRQGLERLEVRNLLAADVMSDDFSFVPKEEAGTEDNSVEFMAFLVKVDESSSTEEGTEDGEPQLEKELRGEEQPELWLESDSEESREAWEINPSMTYRTLSMPGDPLGEEEFIELEIAEGDPLLDDSLYFFSVMSSNMILDDGSVEGEVFEGDVYDDSIFYSMAFGDDGVVDGELFLEMVPGDETAELDGEFDEGEIRTFGGVTSDNPDVYATGGAPFMSPWYNAVNPLDANFDDVVTPLDALIVFNLLSHVGSVQLSHSLFAISSAAEAVDMDESFLVDGNNDGYLSPIDGLLRINFLNEPVATDELDDAALDQGRLGQFASILPGEWDQYETTDDGELNDSVLADDSGDELSTVVFGARLRDPSIDWSDDEVSSDSSDTALDDEFWSKFVDDGSESSLDDELLDILAKA